MSRTTPAPSSASPRNPDGIADLIVDAILAGRIEAGQRLGEQAMADLFGVSRTLVREALGRLSARGMVEVNARRGWYVVQPSVAEAHDAFRARVAIETGLVYALAEPLPAHAINRMKQHVAQERAAIRRGDPGQRSYLLGEFHVCLAECAGNALLADILKDLTARTTLIATLYQSNHDAARSCADHAQIVAALGSGDHVLAAQRVRDHILEVANHLGNPTAAEDPLASLRAALLPAKPQPAASVAAVATLATVAARRPARQRLFTDLLAAPSLAKPSVRSNRRQPKEP